jgi:arsenite-transporting ATPase
MPGEIRTRPEPAEGKRLRPSGHLRRVVMLLGTGGVGKTTCSTAVACALARQGRRVALLTVDPARRLEALARSLGTGEIRCGTGSAGRVHVEKMDVPTLAESYLRRCAPDAATADRLLSSRFYPHLSNRLQAMHEYVAADRILDLLERGEVDHVVVDTPPFAFALHFLEAPRRLGSMARAARKVFPGTAWEGGGEDKSPREGAAEAGGSRPAARGKRRHPLLLLSPVLVRGLSFFLGREFLSDLVDFVAAFGQVFGAMEERARAAQKMFLEQTSFGVVFVPESHSTADLVGFLGARPDWLGLDFVVANRMLEGEPPGDLPGAAALASEFRGEGALGLFKASEVAATARATHRALELLGWLHRAQLKLVDRVVQACPEVGGASVFRLPLVPGGVKSREELEALAQALRFVPFDEQGGEA